MGETGERGCTNGRIELYGMRHGYAEAQGLVGLAWVGEFSVLLEPIRPHSSHSSAGRPRVAAPHIPRDRGPTPIPKPSVAASYRHASCQHTCKLYCIEPLAATGRTKDGCYYMRLIMASRHCRRACLHPPFSIAAAVHILFGLFHMRTAKQSCQPRRMHLRCRRSQAAPEGRHGKWWPR